MKILSSLKSTFKLATVSMAVLSTTSLTNCGGGGSASNENITIRPKTLDGLTLNISQNLMGFEFRKSRDSSIAEENGQIESGSAIYTNLLRNKVIPSITGKNIEVIAPNSFNSVAYQYTPINDNQGELRIVASGPTYPSLIDFVDVLSDAYWLVIPRDAVVPGSDSTIVFNLTFGTDGSVISGIENLQMAPTALANADFIELAGSINVVDDLRVITTGTLNLAASNAAVPIGYSTINELSTLSNSTLNNRTILFTPGAGTTYTVDFSTLNNNGLPQGAFTENGTTLYRDNAGVITPDTGDYIYETIAKTDSATLTLSGGTAVDDIFTLSFTAIEAANQNAAGSYTTASGLSGTFTVNNPLQQ